MDNIDPPQRPPPTGPSMHQRRTQMTGDGIPFPFRLARVSFPRLTPNALAYDVEGGFLSITETKANLNGTIYEGLQARPNGVTFRSPVAINGNMGLDTPVSRNVKDHNGDYGDRMRGNIQIVVNQLNESFKTTYATTTQPSLDLTIADFTNASLLDREANREALMFKEEVDTISSERDFWTQMDVETFKWNALYDLVGACGNDDLKNRARVEGSYMENLPRKRNRAAYDDLRRILSGVTLEQLARDKEIIEIVRFPRLPTSKYNKYMDYGSSIGKILEDGSRSMTAKLEKQLKERTVEIIKTIVNSYKDDPQRTGRALRVPIQRYNPAHPDGLLEADDFTPDSSNMPSYTINNSRMILNEPLWQGNKADYEALRRDNREDMIRNNEMLRFWRSYDDEIPLKYGIDVWKFAVFEWEPFIHKNDDNQYQWPDVFGNPTWKNSFIQSRLVDLRYTVASAFMLDDEKIQNFWAWMPERPDRLKGLLLKFHESVKSGNLQEFEYARMDDFDILSGFNTKDHDVAKLLLTINPIKYDIFNKYSPDSSMIQQINKKVLPITATSRKTIELDLSAIGPAEIKFLNSLPDIKNEIPKLGEGRDYKFETIWAYTVRNPLDGGLRQNQWENIRAAYLAATGLETRQNDEFGQVPLKEKFQVQTTTSNYKITPIVSPVVNKIFVKIREWINDRSISEITSQKFEVREFERKFTNWFRPSSNIYLQHVFGQALSNALTPERIGSQKTTRDVVIAYRTVAQKLIDSIAFVHNLGLREALHIFHVDVINRMIKLAQTMDDSRTENVLKQVAFAVIVEHPVIGLSLTEKRSSYKTIKANIDVLRTAAENSLRTGMENLIRESPGFATDGGYGAQEDAGYPSVDMSDLIINDEENIAPEYTSDPNLWMKFDVWALVLLDESSFQLWNYGIRGIESVQNEIKNKRDVLDILTHDEKRIFDLEEMEPKLSTLLEKNKEDRINSDGVNRQLGRSRKRNSEAPKRSKKDSIKRLRASYAGMK